MSVLRFCEFYCQGESSILYACDHSVGRQSELKPAFLWIGLLFIV